MTKEQLKLIVELIDAKIAEHNAKDSSDGGLIEAILVSKIEKELLDTIADKQ